VLQAIDASTRVVAISMVQFSSGFCVDLASLAELCRERGIFLVADGMQAVGAMPVDVHRRGPDFLACASHKWLLAPFGMGWFYCRRELLERLRPVEVGVDSVVRRDSFLDYRLELLPSAARFECGQINVTGVPGLQAALNLLTDAGKERVWSTIENLNARLVDGLSRRGYHVVSSRRDGERSGIVSFQHERHDSAAIRQRLHDADVIVSLREGLVRVSPHFYNTAEEIDRLLAALPA
jgi:selenocysteine lyase/cysteine desulfurase